MADSTLVDKSDPHIGKVIDGCVLDRKLGQGGMGIAYLATHTELQRPFVIKLLNPTLTSSEDTIQRFYREAQSVAKLNHNNIVAIQNVGHDNGFYFIRMEYVDGVTLESVVRARKKLPWRVASDIIFQTASALAHAHSKGIIHRDIKPENIMFCEGPNVVKVMDFGLAKHVQSATKVSVTGQIVGTPFFMSPEQAGGKETDERSDIYSLGVTYYYLVSGVKPFNGKNLQEIFLKHFFYTPESPKIYTPDLPQEVCDMIRQCLKKKKAERYQSADDIANDLDQILAAHSDEKPQESVTDSAEYLDLRQPSDQESRDAHNAMMEAQADIGSPTITSPEGVNYLDIRGGQGDDEEMGKTAVRNESPFQAPESGDADDGHTEVYNPGGGTAQLSPSMAMNYKVEPDDFDERTKISGPPPESVANVAGSVVENPEEDFDGGQTAIRNTSPQMAAAYTEQFEDDYEPPTMVAQGSDLPALPPIQDEDDDDYEPPTIVAAKPLTETPHNPVEDDEDEYEPPTMVAAKSAFQGMATISEEEEYDPPTMVAKTGAFQAAATIYQEDDDEYEPPTMVAKTGAFQAANTFYDEEGEDDYEPPTIVNPNSPFNAPPPILDQDEYEPPTMVAGASPFSGPNTDGGVTSSTMVQGVDGGITGNTIIKKAFAQTGKMAPHDYGAYNDGEPDLLAARGNTGDEETMAALPGSTGPAMNMDTQLNAPGLPGQVTEVRATALEGNSVVGSDTVMGASDYGASVPDDYEDYDPDAGEEDNKVGVESVSFRSASDFFMDSKSKDKKNKDTEEKAQEGTKVLGGVLDKIPVPPSVLALFAVLLLLGVVTFGYLSWSANSQIAELKADLAAARGNEVALSEFKKKCVQTIGSASLLLDVNEVFALKKAAENELLAITARADKQAQRKKDKDKKKDPKKTPEQIKREKAAKAEQERLQALERKRRRDLDKLYNDEFNACQKLLEGKQYRGAATRLVRLAKRVKNEWPDHSVARRIMIPVTVSSYPSNARVYLDDNRRPEGRTPLTFMLPVFAKSLVRIQEDSFDSVSQKIVANTYNAIDVELTRTIVDQLQLGKGRVPLSADSKRSISTEPVIELTPTLDSDREKNRIFVVSREGILRAFKLEGKGDEKDLQKIWQLAPVISRFGDALSNPAVTKRALFCSGAGITEKLPAQNNRKVYFTVCAIDPDDGSKLWRYNTRSPCTSEPSLCDIKLKSQSYRAVIVGTLDGRVIALDQDTGEPIQNELRQNLVYQTQGSIVSKPYVRNNICYALSKDNRLHAIDFSTSKPSLKFYVDLGDDPSVGPIVHDKWMFVANASGRLQAFELLEDGKLKAAWTFEAGDAIHEKLVFAEDRIYFSTKRRLLCLLQKDGTLAPNWAPQTQSPVTAPVWGTEGAVYVCGGDGILRAIDSQSSQLLWTYELRRKGKALQVKAAPFLLGTNKVVVITTNGAIFSFKR